MSAAEVRLAKSICYLCPVQVSCLTEALDRDDNWGVWGGLTASERKRLKKGLKR